MKADHQSPSTEVDKGEFAPELVLSSVDDDTRARKSNNNGWSCEVCGKKFSSKKALGVHTCVHLNSQKKPPKIIEDDDSEMKTNPRCKLCGKRFPSLRSLCGHMRCHPARERRPPEEVMKKSGGCENPPPSSSDQTELDDDGAYGAACALMLIATGEERYKLSPKDKKEEKINSKKRKRKRNEVGWKVFRCDVCGKSFGSHQALGGHKSSAHTKVFMKTTTTSLVIKLRDKEVLRGQVALGGHRQGSCSSSSMPSEEDRVMRCGEAAKRVVVDVDLNELAPECGGDGDQPALIA